MSNFKSMSCLSTELHYIRTSCLPTQCCSKNYQPCISSTNTQLQMYNEQSEYHFFQSAIWWISFCCQVHFNYITHLYGVSRYGLRWTFWPVWRHTLPPPSATLITRMATSRGEMNREEGGGGEEWYSSYDQSSLWGCEGFNLWAQKSAYSSYVN